MSTVLFLKIWFSKMPQTPVAYVAATWKKTVFFLTEKKWKKGNNNKIPEEYDEEILYPQNWEITMSPKH